MPQKTNDHSEEKLSNGDCVPRRGVDDRDAELGRCIERNIVYTNAGSANDFEARRGVQEIGGDTRGAPADECVVFGDPGLELIGRKSGDFVDVERRLAGEQRYSLGVDLVGNKNAVAHAVIYL
jgi:hypothetical protein